MYVEAYETNGWVINQSFFFRNAVLIRRYAMILIGRTQWMMRTFQFDLNKVMKCKGGKIFAAYSLFELNERAKFTFEIVYASCAIFLFLPHFDVIWIYYWTDARQHGIYLLSSYCCSVRENSSIFFFSQFLCLRPKNFYKLICDTWLAALITEPQGNNQ